MRRKSKIKCLLLVILFNIQSCHWLNQRNNFLTKSWFIHKTCSVSKSSRGRTVKANKRNKLDFAAQVWDFWRLLCHTHRKLSDHFSASGIRRSTSERHKCRKELLSPSAMNRRPTFASSCYIQLGWRTGWDHHKLYAREGKENVN